LQLTRPGAVRPANRLVQRGWTERRPGSCGGVPLKQVRDPVGNQSGRSCYLVDGVADQGGSTLIARLSRLSIATAWRLASMSMCAAHSAGW